MTFITVAGLQDLNVEFGYVSPDHPVIGVGSIGLKQGCDYIVTNNAQNLDKLMADPARQGRTIVAPRELYAKYLWESGIECLPVFEDLRGYQFDPMSVSQQQVALALACWMGSPSIFLVGYQLDSRVETPALQAFLKLYPLTKFAYIRRPNPNRIGIFDEYNNIVVEDTNTFQEMIKNVIPT
jgi:hypothetical protein